MAKTVKETTVVEAREGVETSLDTAGLEPAPQWVLSAENRFDILAFVMVVAMANGAAERGELAMPRARLEGMRARLREFELYEERFHR